MLKRILVTFLFSLCSFGAAQTIDLNNATNGACNAPCQSITFYYTRPVVGELFLIEGGWAGTGLTATISDGMNKFRTITGPTAVGNSATQQIWYVVNTGSPYGITITLNGPTSAGWFDGMFFQVIGIMGINLANPIDFGSVATATGTGQTMAMTAGQVGSAGEMVFGFFLESAAGSPYTPAPGWTEITGGEAISAVVQQTAVSTAVVRPTITSSAPAGTSWAGAAFAVNPGKSGSFIGDAPTCESKAMCYVRAAATGNNNGTDWYNAYPVLPPILARGTTYYVAAGAYPGRLFNDPDLGTNVITIQAATMDNHGDDTGWDTSYTGQAVFNSADPSGIGAIFTFNTNYYTIDGRVGQASTGNPVTDWTKEAAYGFKLDNSAKVACYSDINLGGNANTLPTPVHDIILRSIDVNGSHETDTNGCRENGITAMWGSYNYTIENNYVHDTGLTTLFLRGGHESCSTDLLCGQPDSGAAMMADFGFTTIAPSSFGTGDNILVSHNYFARNFSDDNLHAEGCSCAEGLQDLTIAYNYWQDIDGTGVIATPSGSDWFSGNGSNGPWYIYGNVAFETDCSVYANRTAGVSAFFYKFDAAFIAPIYLLNNTVYNFPARCNSGSGIVLDDGTYASPAKEVVVQNNLWVQSEGTQVANFCNTSDGYPSCTSITWDHNGYFASPDNSGNADSDPNKEIESFVPFVSTGGYNFTLATDTLSGTDTSALWDPNTRDALGVSRGAYNVWDRGALQLSLP